MNVTPPIYPQHTAWSSSSCGFSDTNRSDVHNHTPNACLLFCSSADLAGVLRAHRDALIALPTSLGGLGGLGGLDALSDPVVAFTALEALIGPLIGPRIALKALKALQLPAGGLGDGLMEEGHVAAYTFAARCPRPRIHGGAWQRQRRRICRPQTPPLRMMIA